MKGNLTGEGLIYEGGDDFLYGAVRYIYPSRNILYPFKNKLFNARHTFFFSFVRQRIPERIMPTTTAKIVHNQKQSENMAPLSTSMYFYSFILCAPLSSLHIFLSCILFYFVVVDFIFFFYFILIYYKFSLFSLCTLPSITHILK